jgi:heat shock protein HslJ
MFDRRCIIVAALTLATPLALAQRATETIPSTGQTSPGVQQPPPMPPDTEPSTQLAGTHWTLKQLSGEAIAQDADKKEIYIELNEDDRRLAGSGGCNRLMGSYELDGASLHFRQVASTMMACPGNVMPREQAFIHALSATASFRIHASTLLLRDKDGAVVARFEAQAEPKQ